MRVKYSPTVTAAYAADQNWHTKFNYTIEDGWNQYDPEGYDSYGYNEIGEDRAGNSEHEYYHNDCSMNDDDYNWKYDSALAAWGFDGTKPVLI
jgi:hypothetical protein